MAIVKVGKGGKTLRQAINYAAKDELISGKDCPNDPKEAREQMQATKEQWEKTGGTLYKHYIQSFKPGEVTPEQANQIGHEWAEKNFPNHEVVIGTHADKEHIHNHMIVNTVNFESGRKLHLNKRALERFRAVSDEICKAYGLSIIDRDQKPVKGNLRAGTMAKHQLLQRINNGENVKSYVLDAAIAADQAIDQSGSREEFICNMKKQGYKVDWQEQRKNITLTGADGKKVRMKNLEKTFSNPKFSKGGMEIEFQRFKKQSFERELNTRSFSPSRNRSIEKQYSIEGLGHISTRSAKAGRNHSIDQSIRNIQRELQQIQARAGIGDQSTSDQNSSINRKQLKLGKDDQERD